MPLNDLTAQFHFLESADADGCTRAAVAPEWGANVISLAFWHRALSEPVSMLEPVDIAALSRSPTSFGMPLLAPTPGRVGKNQSGHVTYQGKAYRVEPTRHGLARHLRWTVRRRTNAAIECTSHIRADHRADSFPFDLYATHEVFIEPRGIRSRVTLRNAGNSRTPANVGWHPYIHRPNKCLVRIPADAYWELDGEKEPTPTGRVIPVTDRFDFRAGRELANSEHWDHAFTDLIPEGDMIVCSIAERRTLSARNGTPLDALISRDVLSDWHVPSNGHRRVQSIQLYTPPGRQSISLEPLSCPPDAINLRESGCDRTNLVELAGGESAVFEIRLRLRVEW